MLNDITRCLGRDCHQRHQCARYTAPVPENVPLSWASNLNPERAHLCAYFIPENAMTDHPITPPPELLQQWLTEGHHQDYCTANQYAIAQAARWGADQELEACCEWLDNEIGAVDPCDLRAARRAARRPKLNSLGKTALVSLETIEEDLMVGDEAHPNDFAAIRRALERLQELEGQGDD